MNEHTRNWLQTLAVVRNNTKAREIIEHVECLQSLIEQQAAELAILSQKNPNGDRNPSPGDPCGRSCEGQAYRIESRQALAKVEQQAKEIEALRKLIADIKAWDVDQFITLPHALRERMQAVLDNAEQTGQ